MLFAIKLLPEILKKFNDIRDPITFKQMTSKRGCSFFSGKSARVISKAPSSEKGVTYQEITFNNNI